MKPINTICADQKWYWFLSSGIFTFLGGLFLSLIYKCLCRPPKRRITGERSIRDEKEIHQALNSKRSTRIRDYAGKIISCQTFTGRILAVLNVVINTASFILYLALHDHQHEICAPWSANWIHQLDLYFEVFFLMHFIFRLLSSNNKVWFMLDIYSLVDFLTIPPFFMAIFLDRTWAGCRFLRAIHIMTLPDVLTYMNLIKKHGYKNGFNIICFSVSVLLICAGIIELVENLDTSSTAIKSEKGSTDAGESYFSSLYFLIVTMSTVGFGDMYAKTPVGQAFVVVFLVIFIYMFATYVSEIATSLAEKERYQGTFVTETGKQHVVVCGDINYESVKNFIDDFFIKDRYNSNIKVVFLDKARPDFLLVALIKKYNTKVEYFCGSVMETNGLKRVQIEKAAACLVLAKKHNADSDSEDWANVMRVISIKNYHEDTRVIVQLLNYHNKTFLLNIPSWDWNKGDEAICVAELSLGFIAQSCLAPGFSTLISNLFTVQPKTRKRRLEKWQQEYEHGAEMGLHTEYLSNAFFGLSFSEAAELCFTKLKILLIGIEVKLERSTTICLNPDPKIKIFSAMQGFFIARCIKEVRRAYFYCQSCHGDIDDVRFIKRCKCPQLSSLLMVTLNNRNLGPEKLVPIVPTKSAQSLTETESLNSVLESTNAQKCPSPSPQSRPLRRSKSFSTNKSDRTKKKTLKFVSRYLSIDSTVDLTKLRLSERPLFDATGMYYWCAWRSIKSCVLERKNLLPFPYSNHVIVCIFAESTSTVIGLRNLVMPLRANNIRYDELKVIVIIGNLGSILKEWEDICNFPKLVILPGSPSCRSNLRSVNVNNCSMCIVLTAEGCLVADASSDHEAILCSRGIKSLQIDNYNSRCALGMSDSFDCDEPEWNCDTIPIITRLKYTSNIPLLGDSHSLGLEPSKTQPFACGTIFLDNCLDSLMTTCFFNGNILSLIRAMITGGATLELERILAEGLGMKSGLKNEKVMSHMYRSRISQISLFDSPFQETEIYGDLFVKALRLHNILCIGVYRCIGLRDSLDQSHYDIDCSMRYVITNPSENFPLHVTDRVFVIIRGEQPW